MLLPVVTQMDDWEEVQGDNGKIQRRLYEKKQERISIVVFDACFGDRNSVCGN